MWFQSRMKDKERKHTNKQMFWNEVTGVLSDQAASQTSQTRPKRNINWLSMGTNVIINKFSLLCFDPQFHFLSLCLSLSGAPAHHTERFVSPRASSFTCGQSRSCGVLKRHQCVCFSLCACVCVCVFAMINVKYPIARWC